MESQYWPRNHNIKAHLNNSSLPVETDTNREIGHNLSLHLPNLYITYPFAYLIVFHYYFYMVRDYQQQFYLPLSSKPCAIS